jgi:hypothetical protein
MSEIKPPLQRSKNEAILAIYGEDDFVNGEPLLQTRVRKDQKAVPTLYHYA